VLFLERAHGRKREDALYAELLEAVDVGAKVQLSLGETRWPRPWRERKATRRPSRVPRT
jgi:hypothetical protein